jgi:hypothetical protein
MTQETTNPALSASIAEIGIGQCRENLAIALAVFGAELPQIERIALASALSMASPVDAACAAFRVLATGPELGPVLTARSIELAELIARHCWHGLADEASTYAADARRLLEA